MSHNSSDKVKRPIGAERPFPWRCRRCGKDAVELTTTRYDAEVSHDGTLHAFSIPDLEIPVCRSCGEKVFTEQVDAQVNAALRAHLHLLAPEEIRSALLRLGL